jgi:hypothetical protein
MGEIGLRRQRQHRVAMRGAAARAFPIADRQHYLCSEFLLGSERIPDDALSGALPEPALRLPLEVVLDQIAGKWEVFGS